MSLSKNPAFNLKVVLQETNLAADTLRAWERRYGLPTPSRTEGGHRLYSQYDIETIKWLLARQSEGLSISLAVDLWNEKIASKVDPLAGFAPSILSSLQTTPAIYISPETNLDSLRAQWIQACLNFNESIAEQILNQAFSMFPVEAVCMDVLQKGLSEFGGLWYENRASVQQEHFASGLAMRRLDSLLGGSPTPTRNQTVLVGCPSNEWHTFTPLHLALLLRRRGLNVIHLGANVPVEQFEETVTAVKANLVILVAQTLTTAATLQLTAQTLSGLKVPVGYGGRIFNIHSDMADYIHGYYLGDSLNASLTAIETLLKNKVKPNSLKTISQEYAAVHRAFISKRIHIESTIKEMVPFAAYTEGFDTGIHFLGDNIAAALQLGNMELVTKEMEWVKVLMQSHQRPASELAAFINTYSLAVDKHINGRGAPIKDWLKTQVAAT
ncbi:MAG: MerR family transcriptional regulator [Anaerolineales bacterium]|nr:MerR family transcriptional regulator [Anaerolineales bacterium]